MPPASTTTGCTSSVGHDHTFAVVLAGSPAPGARLVFVLADAISDVATEVTAMNW